MIYLKIFMAFFIPGILGYGGGPASIPLMEHEVVENYGWMDTQEFSEVVAIGNSLPGPIATKMAGYIGYDVGGVPGALIGLFAAVAPSLILMVILMAVLMKYIDQPEVKNLTKVVRPIIAVLLGVMTIEFAFESIEGIGTWYTLFLLAASYVLLEKMKIHPAFVIALALVFGAVTG
ncbi:chromate transporter [Chungangia koreensis]|uniref:Chromate transporter n=1 Tax=Chungangia koreensis TaxID=752657 RepID=A0ABV8X5K5_9LACT